ncbi:MAG: YlxM family DNA-binding protein [Bacilli bacterium]|jgi:predicted DNA-binding protein YlxM (UPF0122 family)
MQLEKNLERFVYLNRLFAMYGKLLTKRQQEVFKMYYQFDLSLQEIADALKISKAAVSDNLSKSEAHLEKFEDVLQLAKKSQNRTILLENLAKTDLNEHQKQLVKELIEGEKYGI